jgi:hypothetical protein
LLLRLDLFPLVRFRQSLPYSRNSRFRTRFPRRALCPCRAPGPVCLLLSLDLFPHIRLLRQSQLKLKNSRLRLSRPPLCSPPRATGHTARPCLNRPSHEPSAGGREQHNGRHTRRILGVNNRSCIDQLQAAGEQGAVEREGLVLAALAALVEAEAGVQRPEERLELLNGAAQLRSP